MQQRLKFLPRTAWAWVIAAELFDQLLFAATHEAQAALDARLAGEALTALGRHLETRARLDLDASSFSVSSIGLLRPVSPVMISALSWRGRAL